ncbi:MAG: anaerobic ribonucleoside-triphosphate reductase [Aquabacterium sp.]|nr:anaerobic ribonucleoside-triphosphate reductase [Aquabacterium sp.]
MNHRPSAAPHPVLQSHERQRCEIWTRVMGYHRPMSSFNVGKQGEFNERVYFSEAAACAPRPQAAAAHA